MLSRLGVVIFALCLSSSALAHALSPHQAAAAAKGLPTKLIDEIITVNADVVVAYTSDGPHYVPGWMSGGTIYLPSANVPPSEWRRGDWSDFYNECFSAWWGNVFMRNNTYRAQRDALRGDTGLRAKYAAAHPRDPWLAQEEGYSETMASVITIAYPRLVYNEETGTYDPHPVPYEDLGYRIGWTVAAVGHSDRPGYTPAAEETYPDAGEYDSLMRWAFGRPAP